MPLTFAVPGDIRVISSFYGSEEMKRHLQNIGFVKGEKVQVLSENPGGIIILVRGSRIALNRGLAQKIMVN